MRSHRPFLLFGLVALLAIGACAKPPEPEPQPTERPRTDHPALAGMAVACEDGDMDACDLLYYSAPAETELESYGAACGGRLGLGAVRPCVELLDNTPPVDKFPSPTVGPATNDAVASNYRSACSWGSVLACDTLTATVSGPLADWASRCGGRFPNVDGTCISRYGLVGLGVVKDLPPLPDPLPAPSLPGSAGVDASDCKAGDLTACDRLADSEDEGTVGSRYGQSCGGRSFETEPSCIDRLGI